MWRASHGSSGTSSESTNIAKNSELEYDVLLKKSMALLWKRAVRYLDDKELPPDAEDYHAEHVKSKEEE